MAYSTIKKKACRCGCGKAPTISFDGWFYAHAPQEIKDRNGERARKSHQAKLNRARMNVLSSKVWKAQKEVGGLKSPENAQNKHLALRAWFLDRRKEMKGWCVCGCGNRSSKDDDRYFKYSAAHVLGKAKFPSIATHPENFIELAFWGGCHSTLDDYGYARTKETKPVLWEIIVRKFKILFPFIAENEIKGIPDVLMEELDK